ncbi:MAG: peptidylprolyl isomerase [Gammaproteobacteria bacterium]|nr:peptidylprolyl isomerase [Gammaproteobacteria bacterium]MDH4253178.1 peptidylprolyl isomerase [Gammaproteobacteria bacterium]MDH5308460.1 peptidylprolyl isomerase [Gammaproteobacteria bacterium]
MRYKTGISIVLLLAAASAAGQVDFFGPAATVNGVEISRAKVQAQSDHLVNQRGLGSGGLTQPSEFRKIQDEVVEQLVVQELLWQEAQKRGYVVSDEQIDAEMNRIKGGFQSDLAFQFKIKEGGYTEASFRENIRQQKSVQRMIAADVSPAAEPSDEDVARFYDDNLEQMAIPEQVRARHILVKFDANDAPGREAALARIQSVQAELEAGANFAILATERSEDSSARSGGDLGFFGRGQMVKPFEESAFALQPGEVSGIVETGFGFHVIRVEERIDASTASLEQAGPQIRDFLRQQKLGGAIEALIEQLRADGEVELHLNQP